MCLAPLSALNKAYMFSQVRPVLPEEILSAEAYVAGKRL